MTFAGAVIKRYGECLTVLVLSAEATTDTGIRGRYRLQGPTWMGKSERRGLNPIVTRPNVRSPWFLAAKLVFFQMSNPCHLHLAGTDTRRHSPWWDQAHSKRSILLPINETQYSYTETGSANRLFLAASSLVISHLPSNG